jgi:hypothetical protein
MTTVGLLLAIGAAGCTAGAEQAATGEGPAHTPALSALDHYEIGQLNARFSHGLDSAADGGHLFADAFTPDGVYVDADGREYQGREQLASFARQDPSGIKGPTNVRHYVTSTLVSAVPGGASSKGYLMVVSPGRGGGATDGGQYWDDLVQTAQGWRIARRTLVRGTQPAAEPRPRRADPSAEAPASASPARPTAGRLTAQDYADIDQLYARYSFAWDGILDDGRMWISLFTPDGIHINETGDQYFKGRDALLAFALQRRKQDNRVPERVNHFITNVLLEVIPEGVMAKAYLLRANIRREGESGSSVSAGGIYYDYLVKTGEGWRFARKSFMAANVPLPQSALVRPESNPR